MLIVLVARRCGGPGPGPTKNSDICFVSPKLILQRGQRKLKFSKAVGDSILFPQGRGVVLLLIPIKTYRYSTCDFSGGLDPPLDMSIFVLFDLILYVPSTILSVKQGQVFLG